MHNDLRSLILEWKKFQEEMPERIRRKELNSIKIGTENILSKMRNNDSEYDKLTEEDLEVLEEILGFEYNL